MDEKATIGIESAAKRLGIGRSLAYELARTGALPGVISLGRRRLVSVVQLEKFLAGEGVPAAAREDTPTAGVADGAGQKTTVLTGR